MNTCGAKTRSGEPCKRRPCPNGRCHLHGGVALSGVNHPNFKHGLYTKEAPLQIQGKIATFLEADPFDLTSELALLRALLSEFLSRFQYTRLDEAGIYTLSHLVNDISRLVERIAKIKNDSALTAAEVSFLAVRTTEIVHRYIDDPQKRQAFIEDLFAGFETADAGSGREPQLFQPR